jgi:ribosomal protein L11 methyltransferase
LASDAPALDLRFAPGPGAGSLQDFLYAELDAFQPLAIQEHDSGDGWRVFFRTTHDRDAARAALQAEFYGALTELSSVNVPDEDWAKQSQAGLTHVRVGNLIVAPPWDIPSAERRPPSAGTIVIEPSMGFGTGHHATTRLCLQLMQQIEIRGRRVIDAGTGSGVLALAAWKLGASSVLGIDYDDDALQNARENVARNGATGAVELRQVDLGDATARELPKADVVLANLTSAALHRFAGVLQDLLTETGELIISGFSPVEFHELVATFECPAAPHVTDGDWTAAILQPSARRR